VTIRRATDVDAELLSHLATRLFSETFGPVNDPADMSAYIAANFSADAERSTLGDADRAVWIAEDDGHAAIGYTTVRRGSTADGVVGMKPAEVQRIYVDAAWHGHGAGHALMRACVAQARAWHCDVIWLGVWERNPRAIAFYEKAGFRVVGRQTFLLGRDVQQDFVMAMSLR
jgi:ribosomal protein S18 acetylase RimI-like enzyme